MISLRRLLVPIILYGTSWGTFGWAAKHTSTRPPQPLRKEMRFRKTEGETFGSSHDSDLVSTLKDRLHLSAYYSLTNSGLIEGQRGSSAVSGVLKTSNSFGVGADFRLKTIADIFTIKGLGHFEFGRSLSSLRWRKDQSLTALDTFENEQALNLWIWSLQAEVSLDDDLSIFAATNINTPSLKNTEGEFTGQVGWHTGAAVKISKDLHIEALWRSLNMSGRLNDYQLNGINFSGLLIRGTLTLN